MDGEDGIEQFGDHRDDMDAVVLDLTMPKLSGEEVFRQIKAARPEVPVILCSGYTQEDVARQFAGVELDGFIEKPFTPSQLIDKLRTVLAEDGTCSRRRKTPAVRIGRNSDKSRNPVPRWFIVRRCGTDRRPTLRMSLRQLFKRVLLPQRPERPLHAIDRRLAKEWIKKRLAALFPELRGDPVALENAYRELGLESTGTVRRPDGEVSTFAMNVSPDVDGPFDQR